MKGYRYKKKQILPSSTTLSFRLPISRSKTESSVSLIIIKAFTNYCIVISNEETFNHAKYDDCSTGRHL